MNEFLSRAGASRTRKLTLALLAILAILLLAPIWLVRYPALVDYPNHLARYFILAHLNDPRFDFGLFYRSNWGPYPYVALDLLGVGLQWLFPIGVVGRIILTLCVAGLPLSAYFFFKQANPENKNLAAWALVIAYNPVLLTGLLNAALCLVVCFFYLGVWLLYMKKPDGSRWAAVLALATLLYFTHLVGFCIAGLVVFVYCILSRQPLRQTTAALSTFVPGALAAVWGMLHHSGYDYRGDHRDAFQWALTTKIRQLFDPFRSFSHWDEILVLIALILCLVIAFWRNPELRVERPWLGVAGVLFLIYWIVPVEYHYLDIRILPFVFILGVCAFKLGRRVRILAAIALLAFLLRAIDINQAFISRQQNLQTMEDSFTAIPPHARVLPIVSAPSDGAYFRLSYVHFWAYGVMERAWFCPFMFNDPGIHPLGFTFKAQKPMQKWLKNDIAQPDWGKLQTDYDYLWVYDMPRFESPIASFAQKIYSNGPIGIFKVDHSAGVKKLSPQNPAEL